jgi:hypothetical protein
MIRAKTANNLFEKCKTREVNVQSDSNDLSAARVLEAISDDKSWTLFSAIAISAPESNRKQSGDGGQILGSSLNLTPTQYYRRVSRLRSLGLIKSKKGTHRLSSFGKIVYEIQKPLEIAVQNRWKFVAFDSMLSSLNTKEFSIEDRIKIINILLGDHDEFKKILLNNN